MQNKSINYTEFTQSRRSISRNLFPLRNNSIRGVSLNHSGGTGNQYTKFNSNNYQNSQMQNSS
jgi:hypothetical protein